jgi:hypothetical protein
MNKTFPTCILAAVIAIVLIRVYPGTSLAFAQTRSAVPQQRQSVVNLNPPTTTDLMNALKSLSAQVGQLQQTVNSQNQTIAQLRQASAVEAQNVHDISGRLGVTCAMTSFTFSKAMGPAINPGYDPDLWCVASGWDTPNPLQEYTQPFYH